MENLTSRRTMMSTCIHRESWRARFLQAQSRTRELAISSALLALTVSSCGAEADSESSGKEGEELTIQECEDISAQTADALARFQARGVLTADATACGENGVANRRSSFDSLATEEAVMSVQEAFAAACEKLAGC